MFRDRKLFATSERAAAGVELSGEAIDSAQALIGAQVRAGVAVRMAVLYELLVGAPTLAAVA